MNELNQKGMTVYAEEKAKTIFDHNEVLAFLREDFPIRTSGEELRKTVQRRAKALGINQDCYIKKTLIPKLASQSSDAKLGNAKQNLRNWWIGKTEINRESAIKIAFALEMGVEEARWFLTHSCGHDDFYLRDYKDLIYMFYLAQGEGYEKARLMISEFAVLDQPNPDVHHAMPEDRITKQLRTEFEKNVTSEDELRKFLLKNDVKFGSFRRLAYEMFIELYEELKRGPGTTLYENENYFYDPDDVLSNKEIRELILMKIPPLRGRHDITNAVLRKIAEKTFSLTGFAEIINKSRDKQTGSIPQVDRRHLIFAWLLIHGDVMPEFGDGSDPNLDFEECMRVINFDVLEACGMPILDARNPFDWLIINALYYCFFKSLEEDAVDRIHAVMDALFPDS